MAKLVIVAYDVNTQTKAGRRRLRRVAQACKSFGVRVQNSVFECLVDDTHSTRLKHLLLSEIDVEKDSLRLYYLDAKAKSNIEHFGCKKPMDLEDPFVF